MMALDFTNMMDDRLGRMTGEGRIHSEGRSSFQHELSVGLRKMRWGLRKAARRLCTLGTKQPVGQYAGQRSISLSQIVGTENRSDEFDIEFHPIKEYLSERWVRVWSAVAQGVPLPPVELLEKDGWYYVRDGHHRISVARALGFEVIEAVVTELLDK
ncbi:MAG: hypothetical protein IPK52_20850 [Chloroflexi bacterium]|nr:hypothetical protein [Chloroflexota bacterium]